MMKNFTNPHAKMRQAKALALWKFVFLLLLTAQVRANDGYAQNTVTLTEKNVPINRVLKKIQRQTGYTYFAPVTLLQKAKYISIDVKDVSLTYALDKIFESQPLTYKIVQKVIIVQERGDQGVSAKGVSINESGPNEGIRGKVTTPEGDPIAGANVSVKGTKKIVTTNSNGEFVIDDVPEGSVIEVSYVGYEKKTFIAKDGIVINTSLAIASKELDVAIVQAYGTTTRRFSTSSIGKVTSAEIMQQPVSNPLASLQGRIPGVSVNLTSGLPGATIQIQIRGQNTLNPNPGSVQINPIDNPLIIIDGVPYAPQNANFNQFPSLAAPGQGNVSIYNNPYGGLSPLNNINPADIESIEVLKDADATAIYGSRGANGVILITTKKGRAGKTTMALNVFSGSSRVTRTMPMMTTDQYRTIRREAYSNDGIIPNATPGNSGYAPDLLIFDSLRNTNWMKFFLGDVSKTTTVNAHMTGGSQNTQLLAGVGYYHESYIYPGDFSNKRLSFNTHMTHKSNDRRFSSDLAVNYSYAENNSSGSVDILSAFRLPPNYPELVKSDGSLNWNYNGESLEDNPLSYLKKLYKSKSYNLISSFQVAYETFPGITIKSNFGYNTFTSDEVSQVPQASIEPTSTVLAFANFGKNDFRTFIVEPQLEVKRNFGKARISFLLGGTYQKNSNSSIHLKGSNYPNDALLGSISGAAIKEASDAFNEYAYIAGFTRFNLQWHNRYILNLTGRRDGSSRFGPGKQFGNFGSVGAGWIFSETQMFKKKLPFISFGKIRASYGTTGNDNIGNYQYLMRWAPGQNPYQGVTGYILQNHFNPDFSWSETRKFETGLDIGIADDRFLITAAWFQHLCTNQLITYSLPSQTGFAGVTANFPAEVQNKGMEISLTSTNIKNKHLTWKSFFNIGTFKNKLLSFPGIENSSYWYLYTVGQSLSAVKGFELVGVDLGTGLFEFSSKAGPTSNPVDYEDYQLIGDLAPKYSGGLGNNIQYKSFQLDFFIQFAKQFGPNYLGQVYSFSPSSYGNLPADFLNRWRKPGDITNIQKLTTQSASTAAAAARKFMNSSGAYGDASYIRLKTLSVSYSIKQSLLQRVKVASCRIYCNAQNLFTITDYQGNDPETKSFYSLPPLKTIVFGLELTL